MKRERQRLLQEQETGKRLKLCQKPLKGKKCRIRLEQKPGRREDRYE